MRGVLLLGAWYLVVGLVSAALAGHAGSHQMVVVWRWAAWIVSAIAFGAHIVYEQVRLGSTPRTAALHVSAAAALGAFGLAAAANLHAQSATPPKHSLLLLLSLAIWPIITMLPAFVAALISAKLLERVRKRVRESESQRV